jgi:hypothetical protein
VADGNTFLRIEKREHDLDGSPLPGFSRSLHIGPQQTVAAEKTGHLEQARVVDLNAL